MLFLGWQPEGSQADILTIIRVRDSRHNTKE
ncbi:hypothetical protein ECRG_02618 [Escherichia coli H617]|uniref:Uncharacterized protein n=2 Tax=Escherichia coli TaxID=562 RepID=A7ZTE7_ECO24|nr:hypothetical protein EcHS_A3805 [Escherichia coli HS]ABV16906.1 hypothetical protein EcE24377A_4097 [Escherichia coli O139:H28 str. E24377A]EGI08836.1 conserved hypothetical protein [Escherichia coli H736]EGI19323.1 conserved hypothetical protein [Escherichia coli M718]OSK59034.1 hypothetical protein EAEG_03796 [Escherichia coli B921]OSK59877.1 hypothetical protein EACG_04246 [Escherichia coli E560]OSK95693.1 hypothetical protein ECWG_03496 [Escherichia coli E1002]OSL02126.1 hypothetical 